MRLFISAVAVSTALATGASAGGVVFFPVPEPVIVAPVTVAAATDWGGFYLGGEFGSLNYTINGAQIPFIVSSETIGGFLGYNIQRNSMVFGVELDGASGTDLTTYNLKGRVGYAFGRSMVYGFLGKSTMNLGAIGEYSGLGYGIGAAYQFNSGIFIGLEAKGANLSSSAVPFTVDTTDAAIRIGWQF